MHPALCTALDRIAVRENCEPTALPPLYEDVDPDALTAVLESNPDVTVRFDYAGYRVVIDPNGVSILDRKR